MKGTTIVVFILNIAVALFSFYVAIAYFKDADALHYILGSILILLAISQYFIQKIRPFKYVVLTTIISIAVFWIIATIDTYA